MKILSISLVLLASVALLFTACKENAKTPTTETGETTPVVEEKPVYQTPEWAKNESIYEVNVRQHTAEGTFAAFEKDLPRLQKLGADILWLMPIFPISETKKKGTLGSYYAVSDFRKVNPQFGTMAEFDSMVKTAHDLGMKVILDFVPNHTGWDHVWITSQPDFYTKDKDGNITDPINYETGESWGWTDVADLNFDNPEMRKALIADMVFWVKEKNLDGYRMDVAHGVPNDFWDEASAAIFEANPDVFMLAEAEVAEHLSSGNFHMNYAWEFHHILNAVAKGKENVEDIWKWHEKDQANTKRGYHMQFITNHDENSWAGTVEERMGEAGDAMAVLTFTFDGMPLIYSGQEAANKKRLEFFEKDPIQWGNYEKQAFYTTLNKLKKDNQAIWNGEFGGVAQRIPTGNDKNVLAYMREKNGDKVVVILNLSGERQEVKLEGDSYVGDYSNVFGKDTVSLTADKALSLNAWDYLVLAVN